ncbi:MAG: hypothetical protein IEMM0008_0746 [bacterium]|nr:MAG: hypothetical protein IEMM0008_0746 [bacterium]
MKHKSQTKKLYRSVIRIFTVVLFLSITTLSYSVYVPFVWDKADGADYYIVEFSEDSSFNDISLVLTPKDNQVIIKVKEGASYYLRVIAIYSKGKNSRPSVVRSIRVSKNGKVAFGNVKRQYPDSKDEAEEAQAIRIHMQAKTRIRLKGKMYHTARWSWRYKMWVRVD